MNWTKEQERALVASFAKWIIIAARILLSHKGSTCACCKAFFHAEPLCKHCPVRITTGRSHCDGTPYVAYAHYKSTVDARAEATFLGRLLLPDLPEITSGDVYRVLPDAMRVYSEAAGEYGMPRPAWEENED
jgi:hypothetical protein